MVRDTASRLLTMRVRYQNAVPARSKCGARALGLDLFDLALARHRHDAQRRDAVALPAQYAKPETVKGKTLAAFGDRTCFVNHEARDRRCLFVGQAPIHRAIEIADRHRT